jgi:hypothetical protein
MSKRRRGLERFLYLYDKDETLRQRYEAAPDQVAQDLNMAPEELAALRTDDLATVYEWGVHPLLIRNYSGFRRLDYYAMLRERGHMPG